MSVQDECFEQIEERCARCFISLQRVEGVGEEDRLGFLQFDARRGPYRLSFRVRVGEMIRAEGHAEYVIRAFQDLELPKICEHIASWWLEERVERYLMERRLSLKKPV